MAVAASLAACQPEGSSPAPRGGRGGDDGETGGRGGGGGSGGAAGRGGSGGSGGRGGSGGARGGADAGAPAPDAGPTECQGNQLVCDTSVKLPRSIKETGLFPDAPAFAKLPERLVPYKPSPELWSDGLHKQRFLLLPKGGKVDNENAARWDFPVGTVLVKTFLDDARGGMRPVETRIIRRIDDPVEPFEFWVYKWNAEGTDAELADLTDPIPVEVTVGGRMFTHNIPSKIHCGDCHTANAQLTSAIIGFDEIRLGGKVKDTDPEPQLAALAKRDLFTGAIPASPATITDPDPVLERVKRFVFGNCVHCHNGQGANPVDLRPEAFVRNTVNKVPQSPGVETPPGWFRIRPRMPERSVVYLQTLGGNLPATLRLMPPVGVKVRDVPAFTAELDAMRAWINSLPVN
jgi:hypothetical protein